MKNVSLHRHLHLSSGVFSLSITYLIAGGTCGPNLSYPIFPSLSYFLSSTGVYLSFTHIPPSPHIPILASH